MEISNHTTQVCSVCSKTLIGKQLKYCSKECKNKVHSSSKKQSQRGSKRKLKLIKLKGEKCELCGYSKSIRALHFHHTDPKTKKFNLDSRKLNGTSWNRILDEAEKCQLLCANCHSELHEQIEQQKFAA